MADTWRPIVETDLLVRRPVGDVYRAFSTDEICRFWLAKTSGPLTTGETVRWHFKIVGAETQVSVINAVPDQLLDLRWDAGQPLRISFEARAESTLVRIRITDFPGDNAAADAIESMSGFTLVLASLKMWLEHGIEGELMYDKFPDSEYADR